VPDIPDWLSDDASINGAVRLLRRVPPGRLNDCKPDTSNFKLHGAVDSLTQIAHGLSITVWETEDDLKDVLRFNEQFGVLCVNAEQVREQGLSIARYPLVGNLNHCEIYGQFSGSRRNALREAARWVKFPANYPEHCTEHLEEF
jgi:hypothetical protein